MNIHDFLQQAINIEEMRKDVPITKAASVVVRFCHYPKIESGVVLFSAPPHDVEWVRDILRDNLEQLFDKVIEETAQIVMNTPDVDEEAKERITSAIHANFGTWPS